jgi:hypothetical protein
MKGRAKRAPSALVVLPLVLSGLGCDDSGAPKIDVLLGAGAARTFVPVSALARYVELAGEPDRLSIVLASYEVGCDRFENPPPGEIFVSVTVEAPPGVGLKAGDFPWPGLVDGVLGAETPVAFPFVRLATEGRALPGGGLLKLDTLEPALHGQVRGALLFQDGSEGGAPTFRLVGPFSARICRAVLDPTRRQNQP